MGQTETKLQETINPFTFSLENIELLDKESFVDRSTLTPETIPSHWIISPKDKKDIEPIKFQVPWEGYSHPGGQDMFKLQKEFLTNKPKEAPNDEILPILKPDWDMLYSPPNPNVPQVTWIGHSTLLVQYRGINFITDPIFGERCSPIQFLGPQRIKPIPFPDINFESFVNLQKYHDPYFLVPYKMKYKWMYKFYQEYSLDIKIIDLDWWDSISCKVSMKKINNDKQEINNLENTTVNNEVLDSIVKFTFLPTQHWSLRNGFDRNEVLWGSWGFEVIHKEENTTSLQIEEKSKKFWFAGDTGYSSKCFTEIGERYGPIDLAFIPIGAYEPRWFMRNQHINPADAVQIYQDIKCRRAVAMHWATFILTTEPVMHPKEFLEEELDRCNIPQECFVTMKHGQTAPFESLHSTTADVTTNTTTILNTENNNNTTSIHLIEEEHIGEENVNLLGEQKL
ncbi:hypothetical protein ABK040_011548 [Willaertia magna]